MLEKSTYPVAYGAREVYIHNLACARVYRDVSMRSSMHISMRSAFRSCMRSYAQEAAKFIRANRRPGICIRSWKNVLSTAE